MDYALFRSRKRESIELIAKLALLFAAVYGPPWVHAEPASEPYIITAYTTGDDFTPAHGITASGKRVKAGETAACPRELPFGTVIEIEGVGRRVCEDRGSAIRGKRIDLYMDSVSEALYFGKQTLGVRVVETPTGE